MAALAEEDRCLNKSNALSSSSEPNETVDGEESSKRKILRDADPDTDNSETADPQQPNLIHTNPIL